MRMSRTTPPRKWLGLSRHTSTAVPLRQAMRVGGQGLPAGRALVFGQLCVRPRSCIRRHRRAVVLHRKLFSQPATVPVDGGGVLARGGGAHP
jgi:hypothetical protein